MLVFSHMFYASKCFSCLYLGEICAVAVDNVLYSLKAPFLPPPPAWMTILFFLERGNTFRVTKMIVSLISLANRKKATLFEYFVEKSRIRGKARLVA